jgi:hypothetical protein
VTIQTSFDAPPTVLVPGESVRLNAAFSHGGVVDQGIGTYIEFGYNTTGPVWVDPGSPHIYNPFHPDHDPASSATFTLDTGEAESGREMQIVAYWRAVAACEVWWNYRAVTRAEAERIEATRTADTGGTDTGGTNTSGTDTSGTDTGGADTSGTDISGADTGGADASGTDTGGTDTSGTGTGGTTGQPGVPAVQGAICGAYTGVSVPAGSTAAAPWDTAAGQNCFERWIREAMGRLNAYDGGSEFNGHKPWDINEYGILVGTGIASVAAPDAFPEYNNNRYWWMWDAYDADSVWGWRNDNWRGAQVPPIRQYVTRCLAEAGGSAPAVTGVSSTPGTFVRSTVPGNDFVPPPYGAFPEPAPVGGMALQAGQRRVPQGALLYVPVYLLNGANVANMNFNIAYNNAVARPEGDLVQGSMLGGALFEHNTAETNLIRVGFAQQSGIYGTGAVTYVPFRAVGQPGSRTDLCLEVTTINDPGGTVLPIDRIHGFIEIVNPDGTGPGGGTGPGSGGVLQGDCVPDGRLDERDATCALQMSVNLRPVLPWIDMDGSGDVTSRDATLILQQANVSRAGR